MTSLKKNAKILWQMTTMNEAECIRYLRAIKEKPYKALPKCKLKKKATGFAGHCLIDWLFNMDSRYLYKDDFHRYIESRRYNYCSGKHFYLEHEDRNVDEFNQLKRLTDYDVSYLGSSRYLFRERTGWYSTELFREYSGREFSLTLTDDSVYDKLSYWVNTAEDYDLVASITGPYNARCYGVTKNKGNKAPYRDPDGVVRIYG